MKDDASGVHGKGPASKLTRRALLAGLAGGAGVVMAQTATGRMIQTAPQARQEAPDDPTKVPGPLPSELGTRSPFENPKRNPSLSSSRTPLEYLHGTITPSDLHYERHHGGVPTIDPERYELLIHGMVDRPMKFTLADLKRFPATSRICFLECSGNLWSSAPEETRAGQICGLTSQSEWTGVMLSTLFREVGVNPKATWFLAEGSDAAVMTRSVPMHKGWDDAMIAYAQNGEPVRPEHGYPARLLLPGWEGNANIKWIRRIEVSDRPFMTREETSKYSEPVKGGKIRQFSFMMDARSIITFPSYPATLEKGWVEIRGIAWSGRGHIQRVEVSTNGGRTWQPAELQAPVLDKAHTRFRLLWDWDGKETEIMSRAIDQTGYVQPTRKALIEARGLGAVPYHLNPITAWKIRKSGDVFFRAEPWSRG